MPGLGCVACCSGVSSKTLPTLFTDQERVDAAGHDLWVLCHVLFDQSPVVLDLQHVEGDSNVVRILLGLGHVGSGLQIVDLTLELDNRLLVMLKTRKNHAPVGEDLVLLVLGLVIVHLNKNLLQG